MPAISTTIQNCAGVVIQEKTIRGIRVIEEVEVSIHKRHDSKPGKLRESMIKLNQ